ncbi:YqjD family protein [Roseateles sp. DXS20W]|uniref:YqjD family protein n=1 Tax=Pelomonas lactea TaxID=3299030 RepID=A0ABW7GNJ1_9BURK
MSDTAQAKEKLAADFRAVMDDIDALMTTTGKDVTVEAKALRARIQERLSGAKEKLLDAQHDAIQRAKDAAVATDDYVHAKPWQAIGVAAAVGLALGVLIGRR